MTSPALTSVTAPGSSAASAAAAAPPAAAAPAESSARRAALPSLAALALAHASPRALEHAFQRGVTPEVEALIGWEFRGINCTPRGTPPLARVAGIQKFVKGMFRAADGRVMGYNAPVVQNVLDGRWQTRPSDAAPRRFGFYEVGPVDPTARDNHYLHALLLDYGKGGNPVWDLSRGLRDYLVQLDDPDRLLGKAYYALGPSRLGVGFFVLERWRPTPLAPPR